MKKPTLKFTQKQQFPQHFLLVYTLHFNCINERFGSAEWIKYATGKIQKALGVKYQLSQGVLGSILPFNWTFSFRHCCENLLVTVCNSFYFPFLGVFPFILKDFAVSRVLFPCCCQHEDIVPFPAQFLLFVDLIEVFEIFRIYLQLRYVNQEIQNAFLVLLQVVRRLV